MKIAINLPPKLATHAWKVSIKRAAAIQTQIAERIKLTPLKGTPRLVAGIDTAVTDDLVFAAIVVMEIPEFKVIEIQCAKGEGTLNFPFSPGYRAFREGATILKAAKNLYNTPDLLFIDGHGACHPRMCGGASHIGVLLDTAAIGCARERLVGHYDPPGPKLGDYRTIRYSPQAPGVVLRSRTGTKPIFVSPGHRIDLLGTVEQTMRCLAHYRIPEPLRRAHIEAGRYMRRERDKASKK